MDPALRVVTRIPLKELWSLTETLPLVRGADLTEADIGERLRGGAKRFVVANCGKPLRWVPLAECYSFWKKEVKPRLVDPVQESRQLEEYPGSDCYFASEWIGHGETVILMEIYH
jgi:hypothetical protein